MPYVAYATDEDFRDYPTGIDVSGLAAGALTRELLRASQWFDIEVGHGPGGFSGGNAGTVLFDGNGKGRMLIPYAISLSGVTVGTNAINAANWIGAPSNAGIYGLPFEEILIYTPPGTNQVQVPFVGGLYFAEGIRNIAITGVWGYQTSPDDLVKEAVILRAADAIKSRAVRTFANSQSGSGGQTDQSAGSKGLRTAKQIASRYKRAVPV